MAFQQPEGDWFFDCDGVLLDSNNVKSLAFETAVISAGYSKAHARRLVKYHRLNSGVSRFAKFAWFFEHVLARSPEPEELEQLLELFATECSRGLLKCSVEPDARGVLSILRKANVRAHVVSGGLETEVYNVLEAHGLAACFHTVNGSPRDKAQILSDLGQVPGSTSNGAFVGDSRYDMEVAKLFGLRRVFVSQWSDFKEWPEYVARRPDILVMKNLGELASLAESLGSTP